MNHRMSKHFVEFMQTSGPFLTDDVDLREYKTLFPSPVSEIDFSPRHPRPFPPPLACVCMCLTVCVCVCLFVWHMRELCRIWCCCCMVARLVDE